MQAMYGPPGKHAVGNLFPGVDPSRGPEAVVAAALAAAAATTEAAERARQAAAVAMAGTGQSPGPLPGMPPWISMPPGMAGYTPSPKPPATPSNRPPGFLVGSGSTMSPPAAAAAAAKAANAAAKAKAASGSDVAKDTSDDKDGLPMKLVRVDDEAEELQITQEPSLQSDDGGALPPKSKSLPAHLGDDDGNAALSEDCPSRGSLEHGSGECTPCAWFWKPESCLNGKECHYCHLCPDGELKKRKKQKMAKMRLGLVTPKARGPPAHMLSLSSLI